MKLSTMILAAALAGTTAAAPAARLTPEAKLEKALAGRVAGEPVSCINLAAVRSSEVIDGQAILYRAGSRVYLNRPRIGADALDDDDILVTRTSLSQLCSLELVTLVDRSSGFFDGSATLGEFVPYTRTPR